MLWENLREEEFLAAIEKSGGVCAIPMGCVEAHGQHLPLGTDVMHSRELTRRAAEKEPICVFPPIYFGEKTGAGEFHGTIIFPESFIMELLSHCCNEIERNGFKKIVIINGHGGNTSLLNTFARSRLLENHKALVYIYPPFMPLPKLILSEIGKYPYLTDEDREVLISYKGKREGHAGFTETGITYDVVPELVRLDKMNELDGKTTGLFSEFARHSLYTPLAWMGNFPNSYEADMHEGMNERIAKAMGQCTVDAMAKMFKFLKEEKVSEEYYKEWARKNFTQ